MENLKPEAEIGDFKGNPTIKIFINNDPNYYFSFGLGKAKAILEYLDEIKNFVKENEDQKEK